MSIFLSKVVIGDLESVEKIIPQQRPLGATQPVSTGRSAQKAVSAGAAQLHIELNKGGKRTFANFQAKTQYFRSRF